jgi:Helix-turn-helix domain
MPGLSCATGGPRRLPGKRGVPPGARAGSPTRPRACSWCFEILLSAIPGCRHPGLAALAVSLLVGPTCPRERAVCGCECERLRVDRQGAAGRLVAQLADIGLDVFEERNGGLSLPPQYTDLVRRLAAGRTASGPVSARILPVGERMTGGPAAASALNLSPGQVRKLCRRRRFAGARHQGRDWVIPAASVDDYRRSRAA